MRLTPRSSLVYKLELRVLLAILLSFLPVFATMDLASATSRSDQITQLQQASQSYAERFNLAQRRIVYMYNLPVDAGPFFNAYNQFNQSIQQLSTDNQNISTAEANLLAAQTALTDLPLLISTSETLISSSALALSQSQEALDLLTPSYSEAIQTRDSAYSAYQATVNNQSVTEDFSGARLNTGIQFNINGTIPVSTTNQNNIYIGSVANGTYAATPNLVLQNPTAVLQIVPPTPASTFEVSTAAVNGNWSMDVQFTDGGGETFWIPNGVSTETQPDGYTMRLTYNAPAGKQIAFVNVPIWQDYYALDNVTFSSNSYDPTAYQTYLDAQAALDLLTPSYQSATSAVSTATSNYNTAVSNYALYSSQQYADQLATTLDTRQQELDTALTDYDISYQDALTKQNDTLVEIEAYEAQVPPVPDAPDFPANTVFYAGDEGWQVTIQAPQYAHLTTVLFASYGTPDNFNTTACHADQTEEIIQSMIDSAPQAPNSITFNVDNGTFTDPCGGVPKWFQFAVQYEYAPTILAPTNVEAIVNSDGSVTLTWDPPQTYGGAEVERYAIFFDDSISAGWAVSSTTTTITIAKEVFESTGGLDVTYNFKVRADNDTSAIYSQFSAPEQTQPSVAPEPEPTNTPTPEPTSQPEPQPTTSLPDSPSPTPEPTATEEPSPTPTPTPTPSETIEPTPTPTTEPTPEETQTPTPEPTPSPIETSTPEPKPSIDPTPTPEPKPTPTPTVEQPLPSPTPSSTPTPTPTPEPTEEPTPTEEPVVVEIKEPITAENIAAVVAELATVAPQQLTEEQQTLITEAALETFETADQGSPEYEAALDALLVVAQADDIVIDEELASAPVIGAAVVAVADALNALGNAGADMSPKVREQSEKVVVAAVIVGQVAMTATAAATSAAAVAARKP